MRTSSKPPPNDHCPDEPGAAGARVPRVLVAAFDRRRARRRSALSRRHLHDAADGVAAEQRALRAAHDLHLRDVAEGQQREVEAAAEGVRADAVHEHQRVVRLAAAREHRRQRAASAAACDGHARQRAQRVGHRLELARLDFVARDDRRCGGRLRERPRHLRGRDDNGFGDGRDVERDRQLRAGVIGQAHDRRIGDQAGRSCDHPVAWRWPLSADRSGRRSSAIDVPASRAGRQRARWRPERAGHPDRRRGPASQRRARGRCRRRERA